MKGKKYVGVAVAAGLITAVAAAPAGAAVGTAGPRDRANLQAMLDRIVDVGAVGVIAEVRDGNRTWRGTSGRARIGGDRAAPVDGRFRMGSVTKSFTATVVLQLVNEGRLELSDSVEQWLPGLVDKGADTASAPGRRPPERRLCLPPWWRPGISDSRPPGSTRGR
ncbi:serine hydrolase [Nonomuraea sp. NPDC003707]